MLLNCIYSTNISTKARAQALTALKNCTEASASLDSCFADLTLLLCPRSFIRHSHIVKPSGLLPTLMKDSDPL